MKKSTIIFIAGNIVVLLIPIVFLLALRFKINAGDIIDLRAQEEAQYKRASLGIINDIELNSRKSAIKLDVVINDSLSRISMDTSTYKYVKFRVVGNKLIVNYDFKKDSIDNFIPDVNNPEKEFSPEEKHVSVHLKSNINNVLAIGGTVTLELINDEKRINDLNVTCKWGHFEFQAPYIKDTSNLDNINNEQPVEVVEEYEYEDAVTTSESTYSNYNYNHSLNVNLFYNSEVSFRQFGSIKTLNLNLKESSQQNLDEIEIPNFNLRIDKESSYMVDVNRLKYINIIYQ